MDAKKIKGRVTRYIVERGFGFISSFNPNIQDSIVLNSDIKMEGFRKLDVGDIVTYEMVQDSKGFKAVNVVILTKAHEKQEVNGNEISRQI